MYLMTSPRHVLNQRDDQMNVSTFELSKSCTHVCSYHMNSIKSDSHFPTTNPSLKPNQSLWLALAALAMVEHEGTPHSRVWKECFSALQASGSTFHPMNWAKRTHAAGGATTPAARAVGAAAGASTTSENEPGQRFHLGQRALRGRLPRTHDESVKFLEAREPVSRSELNSSI